jgi:hypothetical protein
LAGKTFVIVEVVALAALARRIFQQRRSTSSPEG